MKRPTAKEVLDGLVGQTVWGFALAADMLSFQIGARKRAHLGRDRDVGEWALHAIADWEVSDAAGAQLASSARPDKEKLATLEGARIRAIDSLAGALTVDLRDGKRISVTVLGEGYEAWSLFEPWLADHDTIVSKGGVVGWESYLPDDDGE